MGKALRSIVPVIMITAIGVFFVSLGVLTSPPTVSAETTDAKVLDECFAPDQDCQPLLLSVINGAKTEVYVCAYVLTDSAVIKALIAAHARGVAVTVVLDAQQAKSKYSGKLELATAGIPVYIDAKHRIMHNKVILVDQHILVTGSYNFTNNARKFNAENMLVEESPELCALYRANVLKHIAHSTRFYAPSKLLSLGLPIDLPILTITSAQSRVVDIRGDSGINTVFWHGPNNRVATIRWAGDSVQVTYGQEDAPR